MIPVELNRLTLATGKTDDTGEAEYWISDVREYEDMIGFEVFDFSKEPVMQFLYGARRKPKPRARRCSRCWPMWSRWRLRPRPNNEIVRALSSRQGGRIDQPSGECRINIVVARAQVHEAGPQTDPTPQ
jgi:hypothetical protein